MSYSFFIKHPSAETIEFLRQWKSPFNFQTTDLSLDNLLSKLFIENNGLNIPVGVLENTPKIDKRKWLYIAYPSLFELMRDSFQYAKLSKLTEKDNNDFVKHLNNHLKNDLGNFFISKNLILFFSDHMFEFEYKTLSNLTENPFLINEQQDLKLKVFLNDIAMSSFEFSEKKKLQSEMNNLIFFRIGLYPNNKEQESVFISNWDNLPGLSLELSDDEKLAALEKKIFIDERKKMPISNILQKNIKNIKEIFIFINNETFKLERVNLFCKLLTLSKNMKKWNEINTKKNQE